MKKYISLYDTGVKRKNKFYIRQFLNSLVSGLLYWSKITEDVRASVVCVISFQMYHIRNEIRKIFTVIVYF